MIREPGTRITLIAVLAVMFISTRSAPAHIVGIGWNTSTPGSVTISAHHDHKASDIANIDINSMKIKVDGTSYGWTSVFTADSVSGLSGAEIATNYPHFTVSYNGGVLSTGSTAPRTNWLRVTIADLAPGSHTLDLHPISAMIYNMPYGDLSPKMEFTTTEAVPEPATVALLGIGIVGLAGAEVRRSRKKKTDDNS